MNMTLYCAITILHTCQSNNNNHFSFFWSIFFHKVKCNWWDMCYNQRNNIITFDEIFLFKIARKRNQYIWASCFASVYVWGTSQIVSRFWIIFWGRVGFFVELGYLNLSRFWIMVSIVMVWLRAYIGLVVWWPLLSMGLES